MLFLIKMLAKLLWFILIGPSRNTKQPMAIPNTFKRSRIPPTALNKAQTEYSPPSFMRCLDNFGELIYRNGRPLRNRNERTTPQNQAEIPFSSCKSGDVEKFLLKNPEILAKKIRLIALGGCGCFSVRNISSLCLQNIFTIAVATNIQEIEQSKADYGLVLHDPLATHLRRESFSIPLFSEYCLKQLRTLLEGAELVIIVAGVGGRVGTEGAPLVAALCKRIGVRAIGIVATPFNFEGTQRLEAALQGLMTLKKHCDSLVVISNEKLFKTEKPDAHFIKAINKVGETVDSVIKDVCALSDKQVSSEDIKGVLRAAAEISEATVL